MENATDALKIAFAMLIFAIAITIIFIMMSQAKSTADSVTYYTDKTNFYYWNDSSEIKKVSLDQLICNLYNYYKEDIRIAIYDEDGNLNAVFDLSEETKAPWIGSPELIKKRVYCYIYGVDEDTEINGSKVRFGTDWNIGEKTGTDRKILTRKTISNEYAKRKRRLFL